MRFFKYSLLFILFLILGFAGIYFYLYENPEIKTVTLKEIFKGSKFTLLEAPSESLKAEIKNISGEVFWTSRIAEKAIEVKNLSVLLQGEGVETGTDGQVEFNFTETANISIAPNSKVDIVQTLPANLVFSQSKGEVNYKKLSVIPISVRSKLLLVEVLGEVKVKMIEKTDLIEIIGKSKIAYNNSANITKLIEIKEGESLTFNSNNLKVVVK